jgi:hypothetical protein
VPFSIYFILSVVYILFCDAQNKIKYIVRFASQLNRDRLWLVITNTVIRVDSAISLLTGILVSANGGMGGGAPGFVAALGGAGGSLNPAAMLSYTGAGGSSGAGGGRYAHGGSGGSSVFGGGAAGVWTCLKGSAGQVLLPVVTRVRLHTQEVLEPAVLWW